ncbi:MAG: CRISPR-associated protein Csx16 [Candidatus Competibacteraceae bacterium]|nr:MAG: CRISPR-associated protein Csx16 [Candidatus Competibacteraceae bacterium]
MTTYFISRHGGAMDWAQSLGIIVDQVISHFDPECVQTGDIVIGTLPIHLAAHVCAHGGHYLHLSLNVPPEWRGRELSATELRACGARLEGYRVIRETVLDSNFVSLQLSGGLQ